MKLRKYARKVKERGQLVLVHVNREVWLGTDAALYRAGGLPPTIDGDAMMTVLDFDDKAAEKILVVEEESDSDAAVMGMDLSQNGYGDTELRRLNVAMAYKGSVFTPLVADDGELIFLDEGLFEPVEDAIKANREYIRLSMRRKSDGRRYIVVKEGFGVIAAIAPASVLSDEYLGELADYHARCVEQHEKNTQRRTAE